MKEDSAPAASVDDSEDDEDDEDDEDEDDDNDDGDECREDVGEDVDAKSMQILVTGTRESIAVPDLRRPIPIVRVPSLLSPHFESSRSDISLRRAVLLCAKCICHGRLSCEGHS